MNQAQKTGVGMLIAAVIVTVTAFVPGLPPALVTLFHVVPAICGVLGIVVNLPSSTK